MAALATALLLLPLIAVVQSRVPSCDPYDDPYCGSCPPVYTETVTVTITAAPSTVTVTALPSTVTVAQCPPPSSCDNGGLDWAYFTGSGYYPASGNDFTNVYDATFEPAMIKLWTPDSEGVTSVIGGVAIDYYTGTVDIYGETLADDYFFVNHRGYFYAPVSGTYSFVFDWADDKAFVWLGSSAYSGWTAANNNDEVFNGAGSFSTSLDAGTYYPMRVFWGQGFGPLSLDFHISGPDGTVFASSSVECPYFVRFSCDQLAAPSYLPWGQET